MEQPLDQPVDQSAEQSVEQPAEQTANDPFKKYIPIITSICCLASVVLFIGINTEPAIDSWDVYKKWGAPSYMDIFRGDYWGLITTNFVHVEIWHIFFNLYWLWILGKKIEFESNKVFYFFLIMSSGLVSSLAQLSFSTTGIGLSGIGYALFGYLFVKSKTSAAYKDYLDKRTIIYFLVWLVLCVILTKTGAWTVGNAAHIGGMLWGMLLAYASGYNRLVQWASGLIYLATLTALMLYGPFSTAYLSYKAYELHAAQKVEEAISMYKKILKRDPDSEFAKVNLKQLEIGQLQKEALDMHLQRKYREAESLYNKILSIDKDDEWAKENLKLLLIDEKQYEKP